MNPLPETTRENLLTFRLHWDGHWSVKDDSSAFDSDFAPEDLVVFVAKADILSYLSTRLLAMRDALEMLKEDANGNVHADGQEAEA